MIKKLIHMWISFFIAFKAKYSLFHVFILYSQGLTFQNGENFSKIGL